MPEGSDLLTSWFLSQQLYILGIQSIALTFLLIYFCCFIVFVLGHCWLPGDPRYPVRLWVKVSVPGKMCCFSEMGDRACRELKWNNRSSKKFPFTQDKQSKIEWNVPFLNYLGNAGMSTFGTGVSEPSHLFLREATREKGTKVDTDSCMKRFWLPICVLSKKGKYWKTRW